MSKNGSVTAETHRQVKRRISKLEAEIERLKNGECLVKLHNALLAEGEKAKALLQQTEELEAENELYRWLKENSDYVSTVVGNIEVTDEAIKVAMEGE